MKYAFLLFCLSVPFFTACNQNDKGSAEPIAINEIQEMLRDYYEVMSQRDWTTYKAFFSEKATLTTIWQEDENSEPTIFTNSIDEFIAQTPNGPDSQPIFEEKMLENEITTKGNLAQAWVKYEAKFGTSENLMEWGGYDLFSLMKFEDEWKIISITFESDHN